MGFGTLFIGYFLLLNSVNPGVSDIIATLVMLLGLYRLSTVNKKFKIAFITDSVYTAFALGELVIWALDFMEIIDTTAIIPYMGMLRSLLVAVVTIAMLGGIADVAREVELDGVPKRAAIHIYITLGVFGLAILLEAPALVSWLPPAVYAALAIIAVLGPLVTVILNLILIYTCYARIYVPGQEKKNKGNSSDGGFFDAFRRRREERQREDEEYRREQAQRRQERRNNKK